MIDQTIRTQIKGYGVIPVVTVDHVSHAIKLGEALMEAGLGVVEVTLRTRGALNAIEALCREFPTLLVGAGTLLNKEQCDQAQSIGAQFALSPGCDQGIIRYCRSRKMSYMPGVMTPSELRVALHEDCRLIKFFPANAGLDMFKSITAPYAHLDVEFNPTGGIDKRNMAAWLSLPNVLAVGGSWIATRSDITNERWDDIREKAREAVSLAKDVLATTQA